MSRILLSLLLLALLSPIAHAQSTSGTLLIIPANGEVRLVNDEARITLMIEEQDKDKALAASRVNQKMKQGTELVKASDPRASLKTRGYYTYALYADEPARAGKARQQTGWRVGQYLDVTTTNLEALPKTIANVQRLLALSGLQFGLSPTATRKLEQARIDAALRNLEERIAMTTRGLGRNPADAAIETIDFDGSGAYAQADGFAPKALMRAQAVTESVQIEEPSFEPGETTLNMRLVAKVRLK